MLVPLSVKSRLLRVVRIFTDSSWYGYRTIRRFKNSGDVARRKAEANHRETDDEIINTDASILEDYSILTLLEIINELRVRLANKRVCDNTNSSTLAGQLITQKMWRDVPTQRSTPRMKRWRRFLPDWFTSNDNRGTILPQRERILIVVEADLRASTSKATSDSIRYVNPRDSQHMSVRDLRCLKHSQTCTSLVQGRRLPDKRFCAMPETNITTNYRSNSCLYLWQRTFSCWSRNFRRIIAFGFSLHIARFSIFAREVFQYGRLFWLWNSRPTHRWLPQKCHIWT